MFCPKCGSLLLPKKDGNKKMLACSSCSFKSSDVEQATIKDAKNGTTKEVEVVEDKKELQTLPKTDAECPQCHHRKAFFWLVQTRASDEPETKFMKCEKCGHTWRDYS